MNASSPQFTPALEKQAARWAARLDGSVLSARDRIALDAWLAASPVHRDLLSRYCQFSADLEQQLPPSSPRAPSPCRLTPPRVVPLG